MIKLAAQLTAQQVAEMWSEKATLFVNQSIDLSDIRQIDSAGVAFLVKWAQTLQVQQHKFKLTGLPDGLLRLIRLYGVESLFDIQPQ